MRVVITEDIISRALNESIDEFMLEEDMINEKWGDAIKGAWNWVKNAAAMYMDRKTNGQWNNKYGIYANGSGKTTEMYYLNKWFKFHLNEIKSIAYYERNPNRAQTKLKWKIDPKTGEKTAEQTINNYNSIQEYVIQNVNSQNFNTWIKNYIPNRKILECIDNYINNYASKITNINDAINYLNIWSFIKYTPDYLQYNRKDLYRKQLRQQQATQQKQSPLSSQGEEQRNAAANNVQGAQSHWANMTDNKRSRKAF